MRAECRTRTFSEIFPNIDCMNKQKDVVMPSCEDINQEEYAALMGRYAESHIRHENEGQFLCAFFTIMKENLERLRAKLRANKLIRNLNDEEILEGEKYDETRTDKNEALENQATNPDTEVEDPTKPLEYINGQTYGQSEEETKVHNERTLGKVSGIYFYKHSLGSQAYNEFLDSFKQLFAIILSTKEEIIYKEN